MQGSLFGIGVQGAGVQDEGSEMGRKERKFWVVKVLWIQLQAAGVLPTSGLLRSLMKCSQNYLLVQKWEASLHGHEVFFVSGLHMHNYRVGFRRSLEAEVKSTVNCPVSWKPACSDGTGRNPVQACVGLVSGSGRCKPRGLEDFEVVLRAI